MTDWLPILLFVTLVAALLLWVVKVPRGAWEAVATALLLGLAGYALQANLGLPGAPAGATSPTQQVDGASLVEARLQFAETAISGQNTIITADALMRNGRYEYASGLLNGYLGDNPGDAEAWTALGNALFAQAEGNPTEASIEAWRRAVFADEADPAPYFFLGLGWLRAGEFERAQELWRLSLERTPPESQARIVMVERLMQLDTMIERVQGSEKLNE